MQDTLTIVDLELWTSIGVPAAERENAQRLLVTVELLRDTREAGKADAVEKSINYKDVAEDIQKLAQTERKTIECLAEDIASHILTAYKPDAVRITVKKFALPDTAHVALTITRPS